MHAEDFGEFRSVREREVQSKHADGRVIIKTSKVGMMGVGPPEEVDMISALEKGVCNTIQ